MRSSGKFPLVRASLASAMAGHWLANSLADPAEYARIGQTYSGSAFGPILVQTGLVMAIIVLASVWRPRAASRSLSRTATTLLLIGSQLGLSWLFEATERLALGSTYAAAFDGGWLESGLGLELLIAVVSAALLVVLALGVRELVRVLLARKHTWAVLAPVDRRPAREVARPVRYLAGAGAVRAPPLS